VTFQSDRIIRAALPWAQRDLGASDAQRQWVITAYTLAFAGLLLVGGRVADAFGRKRTFVLGLAGFAVASAVGGSAGTFAVLLAARAAQGAFAALLAPTALSLIAVTFTQPRDRARAFAVYGAIAGSGAALGLLLGGVLTQYVGWRWCLYVNVPIAIAAAIGGLRVLSGERSGHRQRLDLPGVVFVTGGLVALVYACTEAASSGWSSGAVIWFLLASAVLLFAFVLREARASAPLLPLQIVLDRNRGGASLAAALALPLTLVQMAVVLAALPTGTGPFILAEFYRREAHITSRTILLSTLGSLVSLSLLLFYMPHNG